MATNEDSVFLLPSRRNYPHVNEYEAGLLAKNELLEQYVAKLLDERVKVCICRVCGGRWDEER